MSQYEYDGHTRRLTWEDVKPGHVVRMVHEEVLPDGELVPGGNTTRTALSAWSDTIIVDVQADDRGATTVRLVRPYMYADGKGTGCRGWKLGVEDYTVEATRLLNTHQIVLTSRGTPVVYDL